MWPDQVSNPGSLTYESGAVPTALRGPACLVQPYVISLYTTRVSIYTLTSGSSVGYTYA